MRTFDNESFKKVVTEQGRTTKWMAKNANRSEGVIRGWLRGTGNPDAAAFKLLCLHMKIEPEKFWIEQDAA